MNVIKIYGGLGNQLSQYAFAMAQKVNGIDVRFTIDFYKHEIKGQWSNFPRKLRLPMFNLDLPIATKRNGTEIGDNGYDSHLLKMDNCNFSGYWQSKHYHQHILSDLRKLFTLKKEYYTNEFLQLKKQITETQSVSVHIRRGDYIGREGFEVLPFLYYLESIKKVKGDLFIFSDDMEWCRQYFKESYFDRKITFVHLEDYLDFELMKLCDHNIISNSTFSWWASYLNENPNKEIIAPKGWQLNKKLVTIMVAYYNRPLLLEKTLRSFLQYNPENFDVVIVDDASSEDIKLPTLPYDVEVIKLKNRSWLNPVIAFNTGLIEVAKRKSEFVILQGVDCYHAGNLIEYVKKMKSNSYISFGCYALSKDENPEKPVIKNKLANVQNTSSWYNHPTIRPVAYNFCSAMTTKNLVRLNGFDERFMKGNAYEDNYFLHQVRSLGLKVIITEEPIVYHQWHPSLTKPSGATDMNRKLYSSLINRKQYRAKHILTPNLIQ